MPNSPRMSSRHAGNRLHPMPEWDHSSAMVQVKVMPMMQTASSWSAETGEPLGTPTMWLKTV